MHPNRRRAREAPQSLAQTCRTALEVVWSRRWLGLTLVAAMPVWLFLTYEWTAIPLNHWWWIISSMLAGFALTGAAGYAVRVVFRGANLKKLYSGVAQVATALWLVAGVGVPWLLVSVGPMMCLTFDVVLRFILADLILFAGLLWIAAVLMPEPDSF